MSPPLRFSRILLAAALSSPLLLASNSWASALTQTTQKACVSEWNAQVTSAMRQAVARIHATGAIVAPARTYSSGQTKPKDSCIIILVGSRADLAALELIGPTAKTQPYAFFPTRTHLHSTNASIAANGQLRLGS
jgi:hypothetical protein